MSCLEVIDTVDAGSDIDFSIRPDNDGSYPDISDATFSLVAYYERSKVFEIDLSTVTANGSSVSLQSDATSQYFAIHIDALDTEGKEGNLSFYTEFISVAYGTRTEAKGIFEICKVL